MKTKTAEDGAILLRELCLSASTKPALGYSRKRQIPKLAASSVVAITRAASGVFGLGYRLEIVPKDFKQYSYVSVGEYQLKESSFCDAPELPIILYDNEDCPLCRQVREACSMLSLAVRFRPAPRKGLRYRREIESRYQKRASFPFLLDPNNGAEIFESTEIIQYLFNRYGRGKIPWTLQNRQLATGTACLGLLARFGAGGSSHGAKRPSEPLVLWAYEGPPFCKIVRELLCSLELEHTVIYAPRGSPNRQNLFDKTGRFQVPYFEDPNTGVGFFESEAICEYLQKMYSVQSPVEYM